MILERDDRGEVGLSRLILIKSGVCDYCEIEPSRATHLSGENGLGKTSILNAIQFLMIDDWNHMNFPNNLSDTVEHYFHSEYSTIIFELLTIEGTNHLIVFRGQAASATQRYARFAIRGSYDQSLFLEFHGNEEFDCKEWSEVVTAMSAQGREIQPFRNASKLRNYLRSTIKWLPTKDQGNVHRDFITLLKTLNTLGTVKERDLKEAMMNIHEGIQRSLDFRTEYGDEWRIHLDRRNLVFKLEEHSIDIEKLTEFEKESESLEEELDSRLDEIGPSVEFYNKNIGEMLEELSTEIARSQDDVKLKEDELTTLEDERIDQKAELKAISVNISGLENEKIWSENQQLSTLQEKYDRAVEEHSNRFSLHQKLTTLEASPGDITLRLNLKEAALKKKTRLLDDSTETIGHALSEHKLLEFDNAFRFLHPDLPAAIGSISDPDKAKDFLDEIESSLDGDSINHRGIEVSNIEDLPASEFQNTEQLRFESKVIKQEIEDLEGQFAIVSNWEKSSTELVELKETMGAAYRELQRLKLWESTGSTELSKEQELQTGVTKELEVMISKQKQMQGELKSILVENSKLKKRHSNYEKKLDTINTEWLELHSEFRDGMAFNPDNRITFDDLGLAIQQTRERMKTLRRCRENSQKVRDRLHAALSHVIHYSTLDEFSTRVIESFDSLEDQRGVVETEWKHLVTNISRSAGLMQDSLKKLQHEIRGINKVFRDIQVSNLDEFEVKFKKKSSDLDLISRFTRFDEFSNDPDTLQAIQSLGESFMNSKSIELADIFSLRFKIRNRDAKKSKTEDDIDNSGSTGTVVLIKAVLLMILLNRRTAWRKNRTAIPFFLDEVGVFGANNKGQIVEIAKKLHFQVFTASTDSMEDADVVYPILGGREGDKIFVIPQHARPKPSRILEEEE